MKVCTFIVFRFETPERELLPVSLLRKHHADLINGYLEQYDFDFDRAANRVLIRIRLRERNELRKKQKSKIAKKRRQQAAAKERAKMWQKYSNRK